MNIIHFFTVTDPNLNLTEIDEWIFAQELDAFRAIIHKHGISDPGHSHSISSSGSGYVHAYIQAQVCNQVNQIFAAQGNAGYLSSAPAFVFKDSEAATLFKLQYGDGCDHKVEERKDCARNYGNDFTNWVYKVGSKEC
ncbi:MULTISPECIES: hypothetical protein [Burkholderia cepacia complex]|uniref:hypothetical protein n=1 Tax=Burkholderia cepacia complex TaxID=87882 RepID=UPI001177358C|nr:MULTISPECIES: hypothetical protein [Burkholderia cepacia complex]